jgi:hypothetical protein
MSLLQAGVSRKIRTRVIGLACCIVVLGCEGASGEPAPEDGDAVLPRDDAGTTDAGTTDARTTDARTDDASAIDGKVTAPSDGGLADRTAAALDGPSPFEKSCGAAGGTLRIPEDLALLAECTELLGSLSIRNTDLTSVRGPDQLRSIEGALIVASNPRLVELRGFDRLHSIGGDLEVRANAKLTTFVALEGLDTVGGTVIVAENAALDAPVLHASARQLRIAQNPLLSNLRDLNVSATETIVIVDNPSLSEADAYLYANDRFTAEQTISGNRSPRGMPTHECGAPDEQTHASYQTLAGCTHLLGSLGLQDTSMKTLGSLGNLRAIAKDVILFRPQRLLDLSGLDNLETIGGALTIRLAERLESLAGADRLRSVGGLTVESNFTLRSVAGLGALAAVTGNVSITNNSMLLQTMAQAFADGLTVGGQKLVSGNGI